MNGKRLGMIGIIVATLFVMSLATTNVHAAAGKPLWCYTTLNSDGGESFDKCGNTPHKCDQFAATDLDPIYTPCHMVK